MIFEEKIIYPFPRIAVMVGQWGVPGWDFFHYCCVPAQRSLFARGGDGLCNYLLDHGHLQVYLWMIISFKQSINVHFRAYQFICLVSFLSSGVWSVYCVEGRS